MKKKVVWLFVAAIIAAGSGMAQAAENPAMKAVDAAVAAVDVNRTQAIADIKAGRFGTGASYVFAYSLDGVMAAHPKNPKLEGKNLLEVPDANGKMFRKEIVAKVKSSGTATVDYDYKNPETGAMERKTTYCRRAADLAVCAGIYN